MPTDSHIATGGPAGPQGIQGPPGPAGPQGIAGPENMRLAQVLLPALAVGNTDILVTWSSPIPNTTYTVVALIEGVAGLLAATDVIIKNGTRTGANVTMTVRNTTLLPITAGSGTLHVNAAWS